MVQVIKTRPLTKEEIVKEVKKIGYKFSTDKPINSVNQALYSQKSLFKNEDGKFSPRTGESERAAPTPSSEGEKPSVKPADVPTASPLTTTGKGKKKGKAASGEPTEIQEK